MTIDGFSFDPQLKNPLSKSIFLLDNLEMPDAKSQLDHQYNEMRWRILSLAADIDRIERLEGGKSVIKSDPRIVRLQQCIDELKSDKPGRAERVQLILSDKSEVA